MAKKPKVIQFQKQEGETTRVVLTVGTATVCVTTRVTTVSPAEVSRADVLALVATAKATSPDDPETWWEVDIPGLEKVDWSERDGLEEEVANALNGWGVSVHDWSPYAI